MTALADDIEPENPQSPPVMHVVSYSEASHLADPATILESIKITRHALAAYRRLRARGLIDDLTNSPEVRSRTENLVAEARTVLAAVESCVTAPYTAQGLYEVFARGFLPVPYLWEGRDEFRAAVDWQTRPVRGGVAVVDENGAVIPAAERLRRMAVGQVERGER